MTQEDTYTVERTAFINADLDRVYEHVVDFHRWPAWSPWEDIDPRMQRIYTGSESGVGSCYEWSGNRKAGQGRMEITSADSTGDQARMVSDLHFIKPFKSDSTMSFTLQREEGGTRITWTVVGPQTLATKVMGIFTSMDKMIGKDFDRGLARLKAVSETPAT